MRITASVKNRPDHHEAVVATEGAVRRIPIAPKDSAPGSSVNGGELLFLALATCYCNDVYREAARAGVQVDEVEVTVKGEFGGPGAPARDVSFDVAVRSPDPEERIRTFLGETDRVAEVQNSLRQGVAVSLGNVTVLP